VRKRRVTYNTAECVENDDGLLLTFYKCENMYIEYNIVFCIPTEGQGDNINLNLLNSLVQSYWRRLQTNHTNTRL